MFRICLTAAVIMGGAAFGRADSTLWYGGDFDGLNGILAMHGPNGDADLYEDFDISPGGATVTRVFGVYVTVSQETVTQAAYEIRSGVSSGNGGTLVAAGTTSASWNFQEFWGGSLSLYRATVSGLNIFLPEGRYWLSVSPLRNDGLWLATTSGANGVGTPLHNGNSFWNSSDFGANFAPTSEILGEGTWDFMYGVAGAPVPESGTFLSLSVFCALLVKSKLNRGARQARGL
jgi:hypothetical protein